MKMGSVIAGALGALMLAESAFALSCIRPDLIRTLEKAKTSPKIYHILVGQLEPIEPNITGHPFQRYNLNERRLRPSKLTHMRFTGFSLAQREQDDTALTDYPLDVEINCSGHWCGHMPATDHDIIAFVEAREGQSPVLRIGACPSKVFQANSKGPRVKKLRQCLDKTCESDLLH